jgi:hypothetical protein
MPAKRSVARAESGGRGQPQLAARRRGHDPVVAGAQFRALPTLQGP